MKHALRIRSAPLRVASLGVLALAGLGAGHGVAHADQDGSGAVYTLTNAASGNAVQILKRAANGTITPAGQVSTGGLGTGAALGSQGSVTISRNKHWLFAVNAGSNTIASLAVGWPGLTLKGTAPSGGQTPISVTEYRGLVYVLNGGNNTIAGFTVGWNGSLTPLSSSIRSLPAGASGPAEISFSPDGDTLVVTEKGANRLDAFPLQANGRTGNPHTLASIGAVPYGFAFDNHGQLIVSDAGSGALSSYNLLDGGWLSLISGPVSDTQAAPCWVAVTGDSKFAYTTNAGSGTISGFAVTPTGALGLLTSSGVSATTGGHPIDMAVSDDSEYLYALDGSGNVDGFRIGSNGGLTPLGSASVPAGVVGLASL